MAMQINTAASSKKASTVLGKKCEATQKNLKKLVTQLGLPEAKMEKHMIPMVPGTKDDVQFASINGVDFYFMKGETVTMPDVVARQLERCGILTKA